MGKIGVVRDGEKEKERCLSNTRRHRSAQHHSADRKGDTHLRRTARTKEDLYQGRSCSPMSYSWSNSSASSSSSFSTPSRLSSS